MSRQRYHYWRLKFQRFRVEDDGGHTPMTAERELQFPDKQLYQVPNHGHGDARQIGASIMVRKGAVGILDSLLFEMRRTPALPGVTKGRKKK